MFIYPDNRLTLLLKQFKFYSGSSTYPATVRITSELRSRRKMAQLRLRSSSFP